MRTANYVFAMILLLLFAGLQYVSFTIVQSRAYSYTEILLSENSTANNIDLIVHNGDLVIRLSDIRGYYMFPNNCNITVEGNVTITRNK